MSAPLTSPQRLQRLEQILAGARPVTGAGAAALPRDLEGVSIERIRQLTADLQARTTSPADEIDVLAARLLLNEYTAVVAQLRSAAREAAARIDAAANPVKDVRRFVWRLDKLRESRRQAIEAAET